MLAIAEAKKAVRPNIFLYDDYKKFVKDHVSFCKKSIPGFSIASFSKRSGVSESHIKLLLTDKREISKDLLEKYIKGLELKKEERLHFKILVQKHGIKLNYSDYDEQRDYFTNSIILALSRFSDFKPSPKWIHLRVNRAISLTRIKNSLAYLLKNGKLRLLNGKWSPSEESGKNSDNRKQHIIKMSRKIADSFLKSFTELHRNSRHRKSFYANITANESTVSKLIEDIQVSTYPNIVKNTYDANDDEDVYFLSVNICKVSENIKNQKFL